MLQWRTAPLIPARPVDSLPALSPAQTLFQELLIVLAPSSVAFDVAVPGRLVVPVTPAYSSTSALEISR